MINLESYSNTVVRGWLAITNVSVFNELFHQKKNAALSIYSEVNYFKGVSMLYNPCWDQGPTVQPILCLYLPVPFGAKRLESQLRSTSIAGSVWQSFRLWGGLLNRAFLILWLHAHTITIFGKSTDFHYSCHSKKKAEVRILCASCLYRLRGLFAVSLNLRGNKLLFMTSWFINVNLRTADEQGWKQHHERDKRTKYNKAQCVFVVNNQ